ncbi:hypothetical protein ACIBTP_25805 [Streptomyces avidinii]|uniref:hypothetical protein n=1 Tax=Streptomyces avidinii TaxID=1895 RepID=UPI00379C67B3
MTTEKNYVVLNDYFGDPTEKRVDALDAKVNRATRPEDIWTAEAQLWSQDPWHCDLAPAVAFERWERVMELTEQCYALEERWPELASAAEEIRKDSAKAHAEAIRKGTKAPATAAKAFEADAALEGCSIVLRETVADLRNARKSYDMLPNDREFVSEYRAAVIAEFKVQRDRVADAFNAAAGAIGVTRRRYITLNELTMNGLLDVPEDAKGYVVLDRVGWGLPALWDALDLITRQVRETDPFLSGEFLTLPMEEVNAKTIQRAEEIQATAVRENYIMPRDGIISTRLIG